MGLTKDLHLEGNNFSNASTAFFIAYLIAEVPNGKLLCNLASDFINATLQVTFFKKCRPVNGWEPTYSCGELQQLAQRQPRITTLSS